MSLCSTVCVRLQILNVEKNLLKSLPDSIRDLRLLQTLNLKGWLQSPRRHRRVCVWLCKFNGADEHVFFSLSLSVLVGNSLSELPSSLSSLSSLRTLDVSDNVIVQLPKCLANIRTLEVCVAAYTLHQGWQTVRATMGSIM